METSSQPTTLSYKEWVVEEAAKVSSDACTFARDWNVWCCYEHDLACHYGKDPREAFRLGSWLEAPYLRRRDADKRFWRCNRTLEPSLWGRVRSDFRFIGVRLGDLWPF